MNKTKRIVALLGIAAITVVACTQTVEEESQGQVSDVSARDTTSAVVTDGPPVGTEPLTHQPPIISLDLSDPHRCDFVRGINACFSDGFHARDLDPDEVKALCAHLDAWLASANESECKPALEALRIKVEAHKDEATVGSAYYDLSSTSLTPHFRGAASL